MSDNTKFTVAKDTLSKVLNVTGEYIVFRFLETEVRFIEFSFSGERVTTGIFDISDYTFVEERNVKLSKKTLESFVKRCSGDVVMEFDENNVKVHDADRPTTSGKYTLLVLFSGEESEVAKFISNVENGTAFSIEEIGGKKIIISRLASMKKNYIIFEAGDLTYDKMNISASEIKYLEWNFSYDNDEDISWEEVITSANGDINRASWKYSIISENVVDELPEEFDMNFQPASFLKSIDDVGKELFMLHFIKAKDDFKLSLICLRAEQDFQSATFLIRSVKKTKVK